MLINLKRIYIFDKKLNKNIVMKDGDLDKLKKQEEENKRNKKIKPVILKSDNTLKTKQTQFPYDKSFEEVSKKIIDEKIIGDEKKQDE